jgi:O-antigen/teichoic acid export membrane protein
MLLINAVANFFLIRSMGIVGAAWATLLSLVSVNIYRTWFLYRRYGLWPFERRTIYMAALIIAVALVVHWLPLFTSPMIDLVVRGAIVSALFWPLAFYLGAAPELAELARRLWGGGKA